MNQYWINFTLIVSGVVIFLAVVAPSILQVIFFSKRNVNEKISDGKNIRSSVWAPIVFMGTFMVLLGISMFSFRFSDCPILLDFMSLASAIVSIILAVLTIVYSYYTSGASVRNIENVQESAKELNCTAQKLDDLSKEIDEDAKSLKQNINRILERLDDIKKRTENIEYLYTNITSGEMKAIDVNDIERFLKGTSIMGLLFLYACSKAEKTHKSIPLEQMFFGDTKLNLMYFTGYSSTLAFLGWLFIKFDKENVAFTIEYLNEDFSKEVDKKVNAFEGPLKDDFLQRKRHIDKYFENQHFDPTK